MDAARGRWGAPGPLAGALGDWDSLAEALGAAAGGPEARRFREAKCFPAALAWAFLQLPPGAPPPPTGRPALVWVLGARTGMEGQLARDGEWGLLAEVFPEVAWDLVLVGPEMDAGEDFAPADGGAGRVRSLGVGLTGHEWAQRAPRQPDFAVCLNSGIGTLALSLVRRWLETVEHLLGLDVPVLFTCFGEKERQGEDLILRQLFRANVLVDFADNPLKPLPEDRPAFYNREVHVPAAIDRIEADGEARVCNAVAWWAWGSALPPEALAEARASGVPRALKELAQAFAIKGAHQGWTEALSSGGRDVGGVALEMLAAALEHPAVAKGLARIHRRVTEAVLSYAKRHGPHPDARACIELLLFAKVRAALGEEVGDDAIRETVRQTIEAEYGSVLAPAGSGQPPGSLYIWARLTNSVITRSYWRSEIYAKSSILDGWPHVPRHLSQAAGWLLLTPRVKGREQVLH